ncbi:lymphocyte antigen 75-like [Mytilus edulis]|uniref:lymphocyte antigen 75-like n=1 Tax=Mytilus edulis TaxID=6550 RepID=UPI0039EFDD58
MIPLKLSWILFLQVVIIRGFSPYFYLGPSTLNYYDSLDYCINIGMKLVKINNDQMNNMAAQFITSEGIFDDVWMSVSCTNQLCHWDDGKTLDYDSWAALEPLLEFGKFSQAYAYVLWNTGAYTELNRPLCFAPPHPDVTFIHGDYNYYEASQECYNLGGQLAVFSNPVAVTFLKDFITYETLTGDIWIGLYGNGAYLTWQNMLESVVYTDWKPGHTVPNPAANVSIAVDKVDGTWVSKTKSTRLPHALCQHNYMPMSYSVDYQTAKQDCEMNALELAMLPTNEMFTVAKNAIVYQGMDVNNDFWIGLTSADGISFKWNDGTDLTEAAWIYGEPTSYAINQRVKLVYTKGFDWDNRAATETSLFLCQYPTANHYPISQDIVEGLTAGVSTPTGNTGQWHVGGTNSSRYFHIDKTDSLPTTLPYLTEYSKTKIYCAYLCLHHGTDCTAFVFKTEQCLIFNSYSSLNTTPDIGSVIWVWV